jgi:hypothetical protein
MGPEMEWFLKALKKTPKERELKVPDRMPREDFQETFKAQTEDTSSSPSGLYYTLWKAIAEIDDLVKVHALWVSLPFMYGFVPTRWLKEINCMLEKKAGVRQIHIMRIIGLIEGDLGAYLKWCYNKHVMPNAEQVGISSNQWGGRKNRSALACAMRKLITWEYFRYIKETMIAFPGDLRSNFDQMLAGINSSISMKKGMSKNACKCRAELVNKFERPVKTAAEVSECTYKYEAGDIRMGGEVQGKPDNMQLWTMTSDILLDLHEQHCEGVTMMGASREMQSHRTADASVDDKDTLARVPNTNEPEEAVENITKYSQTWINLAAVVGQALAFHKSFWQMQAWRKLVGYFIPKPRREFADLDVVVKDRSGKFSKIAYKHVDQPNEGLGLQMCPNGDQGHEFKKRETQAKTIAARVSTTRLQLHEAWTTLTVNVIPSVTYPFAPTRFTKKQLGKIAIPLNKFFLPKLGINRNMKRIALHAPLELGGFNYPCMQTIQDQKNISMAVRQLQLGKEIAIDFKICLSQAQLQSGFVQLILDCTGIPTQYLETGLISHLRDRLAELDGSIVIPDAWMPKIQQVNDKLIMEELALLKDVKKRQLEHANQCRMRLGVVTIAELADIGGTHIPPNRFNGK